MNNNFLVFLKQIKKVDLIILVIYLFLTISMIFFHEPWRDELQSISIVRNIKSLSDFFEVTKYEGHPSLWFLVIYISQIFTDSILFVQFTHLLIMFLGIVIFLKKAPININYKILTIFGYFFTYEYSVIFRNYGIGITLLFLACYFFDKKKVITTSIIIFLTLQTNIYAFIISLSLWLIVILDSYKIDLKKVILGSIIVFIGILTSILDIIPPSDSGFAVGYQKNLQSLSAITNSFIPIQPFKMNFWSMNIISYYSDNNNFFSLLNIIAIFIFIGCLFSLKESKKAQLFFIFSFLLILGFTTFKFTGSVRHQGHLFITFILALWIRNISEKDSKFQKYFISTILVSQVIAGFIAYYFEFKYNFSQAKEVSIFLEKESLKEYDIIGHYHTSVSSISGFINKPIYYPSVKDYGTNVIWNNKSNNRVSSKSLLYLLENKKKINKNTLLITSYKIEDEKLLKEHNISLVKEFTPSIVRDESFYLYK